MEERDEKFDFNDTAQDAIVGYMFQDASFFLRCLDYLPADRFRQAMAKSFVDKLYRYYKQEHLSAGTGAMITWKEFEDVLNREFIADRQTFRQHVEFYERCRISASPGHIDKGWLANNLAQWMRNVETRQAAQQIRLAYNNKGAPAAFEQIAAAAQAIPRISFLGDGSFDFRDYKKLYTEEDDVLADKCCTIGHPTFDELLLNGQSKIKHEEAGYRLDPNNMSTLTRGGLKPGDTTILLGPTNAGKTSAVITVVAANIFLGKRVLLITHEQRDADIVKKIHASLTGLPQKTLRMAATSVENTEPKLALRSAVVMCHNQLTYDPWIKVGGMHVEKVINHIKVRQAEAIKQYGSGYDLLVVDYPAKLRSLELRGKKVSTHEEIGYVYNEFLMLAKELKLHALLPAQTNREGYKVSQAGDDRMVGSGDVAGSFDIARDADNVIAINRSIEDSDRGIVRFFIDKSRSAEAKMTFISQTRFDLSRTHWITQSSSFLKPGQQVSSDILNKLFPAQKPQ